MLINLRNALMAGKRLPYDAEVECLQSTGTQYINTGYMLSGPTTFKLSASFTPTRDERDFFGAHAANTQGSTVCGCYHNFVFGYNYPHARIDGASLGSSEITTDIEYALSQSSRTLKVNGTTYSGNGATFPNLAVTLFRGNENTAYYGQFKCYAFQIYDANNTLVRDFIPVRKGTVGYLYDRVSGKLFGNAGTGDFTCGPDVVPVEYLQSSGTQYIDTETLVEMTDKVDCTFELLAYGNVTLAGGRVDSSTSSWTIWAYTNNERRIRFDLLSDNHGGVVTSIAPTLGQEYKVSKIGERNFVDGVEVQSNSSVAYTPVRTCYLFAMNNGGTASFIGNCRIKGFSIGSKLKYRPVRVGTDATSWEGAMMDVLTRRIYRNQGTGAFTYGNDLKYPIPAE